METKNKILAFLAVCMIVSLTGIAIYQQQQVNKANDYIKSLEEQLNNYEEVETEDGTFHATVYWFVQREGSSNLTFVYSEHNVVTNAGRSALRGHIADAALDCWNYTAIGEGTGGDAASTTLVNEFARAEAAYATVSTYNFTLTYTWTAGTFAGETIQEAGVFNDPVADSGTMISYQSFAGIVLNSGDSLQVQWMFQVGT